MAVKAGTEFESKSGKVKAVVVMEVKSTKKNKCYLCQLYQNDEMVEEKIIQSCNLKWGSFGTTSEEYPDKRLRDKLRRDLWNINNRIRTAKSYKNVKNCFENFNEFYWFFSDYLEEHFHLYEQFIKGNLEIDKDLKSYILYGKSKKAYSRDTITLLTTQANRALTAILNEDISEEHKIKKLNQVLQTSLQ